MREVKEYTTTGIVKGWLKSKKLLDAKAIRAGTKL